MGDYLQDGKTKRPFSEKRPLVAKRPPGDGWTTTTGDSYLKVEVHPSTASLWLCLGMTPRPTAWAQKGFKTKTG